MVDTSFAEDYTMPVKNAVGRTDTAWNMAAAHIFLTPGVGGDTFDGQIDFDQAPW
jgi:hypothetical protein